MSWPPPQPSWSDLEHTTLSLSIDSSSKKKKALRGKRIWPVYEMRAGTPRAGCISFRAKCFKKFRHNVS